MAGFMGGHFDRDRVVFDQDFLLGLFLYLDSLDDSSLPLRSGHELGMDEALAHSFA